VEGLVGGFSAALPRFGLAAEQLSDAVAAAGAGYERTDADVADACAGGQGGE
jgi:hypothetical protein